MRENLVGDGAMGGHNTLASARLVVVLISHGHACKTRRFEEFLELAG